MRYLFYDTEATGIPSNYQAPITDIWNWPRMVQIAWLLCNPDGFILDSREYIVKPEGFTIPRDAEKIHGITTNRAAAEGTELRKVLSAFSDAARQASVLIAHNVAVDEKIVGAEFMRMKAHTCFDGKKRVCTMQKSTAYCRLPGKRGYKWPTLNELHRILFNTGRISSHNALADVQDCARCFFELKRIGVISDV